MTQFISYEYIATLFVGQPLALPGCAKNCDYFGRFVAMEIKVKCKLLQHLFVELEIVVLVL